MVEPVPYGRLHAGAFGVATWIEARLPLKNFMICTPIGAASTSDSSPRSTKIDNATSGDEYGAKNTNHACVGRSRPLPPHCAVPVLPPPSAGTPAARNQ